ncbi:E3 ubiquitin-protein ligase listerin [Vanessa cardui]|uniref:E3 ubiquitin-protein ligase listerin n=1 Tax=Vanessa cardui TaxID=171605 RepID=UPI001F144CFA|nr:E3 ubiquitin-protein ligase listerin [Vanessa cardui]
MGGKKQSQRTKNNVRPSSSGRSAELLSNTIKVDSTFGVLGQGKPLPVLFSTLSSVSNIDLGLSPEFSICFKKLNKKDPITKTKALQELTELVKNSNVDEVVAALPSWAHFYQTLIIDSDRRVREAAQLCHGALLAASGRRAAPQLRRLLPAWLLARHDDHAPVSAQAHAQLKSTFPESKLGEAISFCKSEIITLLIDNLTGNAEAMLSKKLDNPEEREIQIARVLCSSLKALDLFLTELPDAHDDWLWDAMGPLLQANAFWKLAAHQSQNIRAAWYGAAGRAAARGGARRAAGARALRALLARAEGGGVAAQRWAALLHVMHCREEWHTWLDKKDLLMKRLLEVIENGGWGDARLLSNMLLPLLAKLPADLITKDFYMAFFSAIFNGFNNKILISSKSERQTWINILEECLRYLSIQQHEYIIEVVTFVHRTWLEKIFEYADTQVKNHLIKHSSTTMASLVKYWLKQTKQENSEKYDQLIRNFWLNIGSTIATQIDKLTVDKDDIVQLIESHMLLLQTLKTAFLQDGKKQHRIQFADEKSPDVEDPPPAVTEQCDVSLIERFDHNLNEVVESTCCKYFDFAREKQVSQAVFTSLITLMIKFESKNLFLALARHFNQDSVYGLYDAVLRSWLAGDTMRCKALVDLIFIILKYLTEEEQDGMFKSFQQFPPFVVEWCISRTLSHPHRSSAAGKRWLRSDVVEDTVVALCKREEDSDADNMLLKCLSPDDTGEAALSERGVARAVRELSAAPRSARAARAAAALAPCALALPLHDALFRVSLEHPAGGAGVRARAAWSGALVALAGEARGRLVSLARAALHAHVHSRTDELDMKRIEHAASLCPYLFLSGLNIAPENGSEIVSQTKELFEMQTQRPEVPIEVFALRCDCIEGNINCPFEDENEFIATVVRDSDKDHEELTKKDLILFLNESLFRAAFLRAILSKNAVADEDDDESESWCDVLLAEEYFKAKLNRVLYEYAVLSVLYDKYAFWPDYEVIKKSKERMENLIEDILSEITPETKNAVMSYIHENAITKGYYWSYAKKLFVVKMNKIAHRIRESQNETPESQTSFDDRPEDGKVCDEKSEKEDDSETRNKTPENESDEYQSVIENLDMSKLEKMITGSGFFHSLQADAAPSERSRALLMLRSVWRAHAHEPAVRARAAAALQAAPADVVIDLYYQHNHIMLYETDLTAAPWSQIVSNAAIVQFLTEGVRSRGWELGAHQWDFTTITLCSLVTSLRLSAHRWWCCKVAIVARAVLELFGAVHEFVSGVRAEAERRQPSAHVLALPTEWADIFAPDLNKNLFELLMIMLKQDGRPMTSCRVSSVGALAAAGARLQWARAPAALSLRAACAAACAALRGVAHPALKYLAFATLDLLAEPLVLHDAEKLAEWCGREDNSPRPEFTLTYYDETLVHLQDLVDAALSNINVCEGTCEMVAPSDSHSVALGHQLLAVALLRHCARARGDLAQFYIELLREGAYAAGLMSSCVRLLPADVLRAALEGTERPSLPARWLRCFSELPALDVYKRCDGETVSALACAVLAETLGGAAAGEARGWCGALGVRAAAALRRVVRAAVAPALRRRLLLQLRDRAHELPDSQVTIQWSRAEVRCELQLEERTLELTVQFAEEHPLVPPQVTAPPNSPAPDTQWIVLYLAYQNGTLLNALKMWISAVTARVQSSPQCYICYCRMHPSTGRLPTVPCHQCRNKFHSPCLRKWFSTSNKSNCPLCRTKF